MVTQEIKDNIRKHYSDTDQDLKDLEEIMAALDGMDKVEQLKSELETSRLEADKRVKELDQSWRTRYRERFFDGDASTGDLFTDPDTDSEDDKLSGSIDDFLSEMNNRKGEW